MRPPRPVTVQSAAALIVILLAILAQQIFRSRTNGHPPTAPPDNQPTDLAPSDTPTTRPDVAFRSPQALDDHFRKHAREFGPNVSRDDYLRRAQALRDAPAGGPILESKRPDGVTARFDRRTGDFLAFNPDNTLRTFFRPNDGERYFHRQSQRDPE
jgi:pyocin large subunit-like protein